MLTDAILRLPAVKAATGLSKTTIYARMGLGTFPAAVPIDGGRVGWPESAIQAWIAAKKAGMPWQPPIDTTPSVSPHADPQSPPLVDRSEVVKNRVKKPRKAAQGFQLTADPPAAPMKRAQKPTSRRPRSSRNEGTHDTTQSEFRFD